LEWLRWRSGAYEPRMCSLTSRVLLSSPAALGGQSIGCSNVLLAQLRQDLTSVGDPELLRIIRRPVRLQP
jgi:hypothetical protein